MLGASATVFTHQLRQLLILAGALERLRQDPAMLRQFNIANTWVPAWRYSADPADHNDAEDFLAAVDAMRTWINNNI